MKTEAEIRMDFENAKKTADMIEQIAQDLSRRCGQPVRESCDMLSSKWEGPAKRAFFKKLYGANGIFDWLFGLLGKLATYIRQKAKIMYEAEMRNVERARTRGGGGSIR